MFVGFSSIYVLIFLKIPVSWPFFSTDWSDVLWFMRGGGLASWVIWEELSERQSVADLRPWCIIVPSDPMNILNHQSKQSYPPVNTQGEALHSQQFPTAQVLRPMLPLWNLHTHGLRQTYCSQAAVQYRPDQAWLMLLFLKWQMTKWCQDVIPVFMLYLVPFKTHSKK